MKQLNPSESEQSVNDKKTPDVKVEIHLDEETAQGVYANLAVVNHSDAEFTIDFIFVQPQVPKAKVRSRIITSPKHLKRLIAALQENLQSYENAFGPLPSIPPIKTAETDYH